MRKAVLLCSFLYAATGWAQQADAPEPTPTESADTPSGETPAEAPKEPTDEEPEPAPPTEAIPEPSDDTSSAEAAEKPAKKPIKEADPEPAPAAPEPAPAAPVAPPTAPPMNPKLDGLTLGAQVIFAAALASDSLKDAETGRLAGAFSTANGDWLDPKTTPAGLLKKFADTITPLGDVDPQDGAAVGGKRTELLDAVGAAKSLAEASARPVLRADILAGLETFKTALRPPYAHGQSRQKIYGWTLAGFGGLVTLTGGTALINPQEPNRLGFATTATTAGILLAGAGAAMVLLDDTP
ncbi:MAG TPA: hypothetical protein DEB46_03370 [Myxococcales bacterium]|nr:hypothetical protein [Myxococcales bacterium]